MKKPHKTSLFDRLKDAVNAFNRKPYSSMRYGLEVKRCDECEHRYRDEEKITKCDKCPHLVECIEDGQVIRIDTTMDRYSHFEPCLGGYCKVDGRKEM